MIRLALRFQDILTASLVALLSMTFVSSAGAADIIEGVTTLEMEKKCRAGKPRREEDRVRALRDAKVAALNSWMSNKSKAYGDLFASAEEEIISDINKYVINAAVTYESCTGAGRSYVVGIEAEANVGAIDRLLERNKPKVVGPRSRMTAVFIARKQMSVKSYDAKVTAISENQEFSEAEQSAEVAGESISATGYSSTRNVTTTGGSSELKSAKISWDVFQSDGLDAAVNEAFASNGFRVIDASQVAGRFPGFDLAAFRSEFGEGDDLTPETKNAAFNAIAGKIPLLIIATVDVLQARTNEFGNIEVYAQVKGQVYRDDGLFYEVVVSVKPTQEKGEGPSASVAETAALIAAAETASGEMINQLYAQGIY
jgi:hypothetical protein